MTTFRRGAAARASWLGALLIGALFLGTVASCGLPPGMRVVQATYGANCGAPLGNVTSFLEGACDGKMTCPYQVWMGTLGNPKKGCHKTFDVVWRCPGEEEVRRIHMPAEAGLGGTARLTCEAPKPAARP